MRVLLLTAFLLLCVAGNLSAQLVRKIDYDVAFAVQAGGDFGMLLPGRSPQVRVQPTAGLKMTFPFTRKWFLGSEVNYTRLRYAGHYSVSDGFPGDGDVPYDGDIKARFDLSRMQVPIYIKYMLNSNKASVLFGFYGSWVFEGKLSAWIPDRPELSLAGNLEKWDAGVTVGYERRIVKHLNLLFRVSAGGKKVLKNNQMWDNRCILPLQASLTLSFDVLRIGDCGCD